MTIFYGVYDIEHSDVTLGIQKKYDGFNEGVLASYQLKFNDVTIANMKTLRQSIEDYRLVEGDEEEEERLGETIYDAARRVAETVPEEIAYTLQDHAYEISQCHDVFAEWIDRVFERINE